MVLKFEGKHILGVCHVIVTCKYCVCDFSYVLDCQLYTAFVPSVPSFFTGNCGGFLTIMLSFSGYKSNIYWQKPFDLSSSVSWLKTRNHCISARNDFSHEHLTFRQCRGYLMYRLFSAWLTQTCKNFWPSSCRWTLIWFLCLYVKWGFSGALIFKH